MKKDCLNYLLWMGHSKKEALCMMRNASEGFIRQCAEAWRDHCRKAFEED